MKKIARFIVNKKNLILFLFIVLIAYCVWGMGQVNIEYDITAYLPSDTDTKKALDIMREEFVTFGTTSMVVRNISFEDAVALHDEIEALDGVKSFEFHNTEDYYKHSTALFDITFEGDENDAESVAAYEKITALLKDRDLLIASSLVNSFADQMQKDINFVLILAVVIIVAVLALTLRSFGEIPVFLLTFGVAALLNMGTNHWFGKISFISNTVCVILQLALAIDYAIILSHRFSEEKKKGLTLKEAMTEALAKAIPEIGGSSLTTIAGLLALTTMALRLGADLGLVLAKSILCSMVTVFLFMPTVMLFFSKFIDKTAHKNFVPRITFFGKFVVKLRHVIPAVFVVAAVVCGYFSFKTEFVYSTISIDTLRYSPTQIAQREKDAVFGYANQLAVLIPKDDFSMEKRVIDTVGAHEQVKEALAISNVEISANGQTHCLTDRLNYKQFAMLLGSDAATAANIFRAYAGFSKDNVQDGISEVALFEANKDNYTASILDICDCAFKHDDFIAAILSDNDELSDTYETLRGTLQDGEAQLIGADYTRVLFILNCDVESKETFKLIETLRDEVKAFCPGAIFAGDSMSSYDLDQSFSTDNLKVSILTVLFVFVILMFTFRSWGIPIPLAATIQGAIFINFSICAFTEMNLFFFVYLIVSAIQMGATIDYAIVITNRFQELKSKMDRKKAMVEALNLAFPTILTSGSILAVAGFLIGSIVSDPLIGTLGTCLGRGVVISIASVMIVLPTLLLVFDPWLEKTKFKPRKLLKIPLKAIKEVRRAIAPKQEESNEK